MKLKRNLSLLLLINCSVSIVNSHILSNILSADSSIDKGFILNYVDLLDPRNIAKSVSSIGGDIVRQVSKKLGASNEVIKLANAQVPEMIQYHGYPVEVHEIQTEDGYLFDVHRIPHGRFGDQNMKRGVVILAHGILCSSACWLFLGPGRALPYILADLGYDVWLTNIRGNTYGRKHISMNPDTNSKFWKFSFHEVGMYDFPATINYIRSITGEQQVFFIAHSSATTAFFVMCSERPEYNNYIRANIDLAPAAHVKHVQNPLLYFLSQFINTWHVLIHLVGYDEFLPNHTLLQRLGGTLCTIEPLSELICSNSMFALCGFNKKQLNSTIIPIIYGHTPAGTTLKTLVHYGQMIRNFRDRFQYFSYGVTNPLVYKSLFPPKYHLSRVTPPVYCFFGRGDWLVTEKDVLITCNELPNLHDKIAVSDKDWTHNDFVYANSAKEEVYDKIVEILKKH